MANIPNKRILPATSRAKAVSLKVEQRTLKQECHIREAKQWCWMVHNENLGQI